MSDDILIKCLRENGRSVHAFVDAQGSRDWALPSAGKAGAWKGPVAGTLKPHHNGLHLAKKDYLIDWLTGYHYLAQTEGETAAGLDCIVARKARLMERLPVDEAKLKLFCENWISMVPEILDALAVYPKISKDARACAEAIRDKGLDKANETLARLPEFKYVRQTTMRFSYDELHSIEYHHCTTAAKTGLESIVNTFRMASKHSKAIDFTRVLSNNIARSLGELHTNYLFMQGLQDKGYDHKEEIGAMKSFLEEKNLITLPETGFFAAIRQRQNAQILPALGF